jgi:hypothetical protein
LQSTAAGAAVGAGVAVWQAESINASTKTRLVIRTSLFFIFLLLLIKIGSSFGRMDLTGNDLHLQSQTSTRLILLQRTRLSE